MITLIYDEDGILIADKKAIDWVKDLKNCQDEHEVKVANEIVFTAARVLVLEKFYTPNEIQFKHGEEILKINSNGRQSNWPKGFCDTNDEFLDKLLQL